MALDQEEFTFPDEQEEENTELESTEVEDSSDEIEVEEVDDTPEEDRGVEPLPEKIVKELDDDDLSEYSNRVKTRLSQMKKVWHDERRAKESAARERDEALRYAQQAAQESQRLRQTLSAGEGEYIKLMQSSAALELEKAKQEYGVAYDSGDTEQIISAQEKLNEAQFRARQAAAYKPQYVQSQQENSLQTQETRVNSQSQQTQVRTPDQKALAWQAKNTWFGSDEEMTAASLGLHEKLVKSGVHPQSDEYYKRIDQTMRKRFPEYFGVDTQDEETPRPRKAATVVAPATRSTAPKKVVLTKTQIALAKKFGLTPEQYAREQAKLGA